MPLMGRLERGKQMLSLCTSLYNTPLVEQEVSMMMMMVVVVMIVNDDE